MLNGIFAKRINTVMLLDGYLNLIKSWIELHKL